MKKQLLIYCFLFYAFSSGAQKNWQLSIQTWTFHKYSFLESVEKADSLGVKYLEVYPGQKVRNSFRKALAPSSVESAVTN